MPGRGCLLSPFTRRFRLGFALLRGGSRINHHRSGVLTLKVKSTEHSVLSTADSPRHHCKLGGGSASILRLLRCRLSLYSLPPRDHFPSWCGLTLPNRMCDDDDLLSLDLNRDLSQKEGLRGHPRPGVDSNVSAWSRPSVVAAHTANLPGVCTLRRGGAGFQDGPSQGRWSVCVECLIGKQNKPTLFKVTEPSSVPYRTPSACAK